MQPYKPTIYTLRHGVAEPCEQCGRAIASNEDVYVIAIGGGYMLACATHEEPDADYYHVARTVEAS